MLAQSEARCLQNLAKVESTHLGVLEHMRSFELRSLSTLRNAARILVRNGKEDTCEELVEAVAGIFEERRADLVEAGFMVDVENQDRMARLHEASRVEDLVVPLRAGDVIGAEICNTQNWYLGEVSDVVFDPDRRQITHAMVEVGGFLGLSEEIVSPAGANRKSG
jgi:PRC-barrel domain